MTYYQFGTDTLRGDGTLTTVTIVAESLEEAFGLLQELISTKYTPCYWWLCDCYPYK